MFHKFKKIKLYINFIDLIIASLITTGILLLIFTPFAFPYKTIDFIFLCFSIIPVIMLYKWFLRTRILMFIYSVFLLSGISTLILSILNNVGVLSGVISFSEFSKYISDYISEHQYLI